MTPHLDEEDLILFYYREPSARADAAGHLAECTECAAALESLSATLRAVDADDCPVPPGLASRVWMGLQHEIPAPRPRRWPKPLAWMSAAAAIALASFFLGRHTALAPPAQTTAEIRERVLLSAMAQHLERSRVLLSEVSHAQPGADLAGERAEARDLLASNRLYRHTAAMAGRYDYQDLLDDLEQALLEIAQAAGEHPRPAENLMFRMQVIESKIEPEEGEL